MMESPFPLSPPVYNVLLGLSITVYIKVAIALGDYSVRKGWVSHLASRKFVHLAATATLLWWPFFDDSHWTWRLNTITCTLYSVQLVFQGLIFPDPNDPEVKAITRTGNPNELLIGPLAFALVLVYVGHFAFKQELAVYLMASMGVGDGVAPIVGSLYPFGHYKTAGGEVKTLSGSLGMFLGTVAGVYILRHVLEVPKEIDLQRVVGIAVAATISEAIGGMWDNFTVIIAVLAYLYATSGALREQEL